MRASAGKAALETAAAGAEEQPGSAAVAEVEGPADTVAGVGLAGTAGWCTDCTADSVEAASAAAGSMAVAGSAAEEVRLAVADTADRARKDARSRSARMMARWGSSSGPSRCK